MNITVFMTSFVNNFAYIFLFRVDSDINKVDTFMHENVLLLGIYFILYRIMVRNYKKGARRKWGVLTQYINKSLAWMF